MSALGGAWRTDNARWLRLVLRRLRVDLYRHALAAAPTEERPIAWLVAADDAELARGTSAEVDERIAALDRELAAAASSPPPALLSVAELAGLSDLERAILLLAAAPSLDAGFAQAYAELAAGSRPGYATPQLALAMLVREADDRLVAGDCLMATRPLRRLHLVDVGGDEREPMLLRALSVDERMVDYLRGANHVDARLAPLLVPVPVRLPTEAATRAGDEAAAIIAGDAAHWTTINLIGAASQGAIDAAVHACEMLDLAPRALDVARFATHPAIERADLAALIGREALLAGIAVIVDATSAGDAMPLADARRAIEELIASLAATLFVISADRWASARDVATLHVSAPSRAEQTVLWRQALSPHAHSVNGEVDAIVQQFDLGPGAIADVVGRAARRGDEIRGRDLWRECRLQTGAALDEMAQRITPCFGWDDIVVGDDVRTQLRELASQVEQRGRVYESWGFGERLGRGRGITALFAGPSGTGKTMAAEIIAAHLELDLYRVDLAGVVSKYIGETEKNLRRVFDAAERSGAILFFDEADALFGTRTEVRDSHDRYANLEVNYLLQRMEDYGGLAILATNRRTALDAAFVRRLRFIVDFPFPGVDDRRRIWERAFPPQAATDGLELSFLSRLDLSGGNIKSVAVNAAFLAASERCAIGMPHVVRAAAREYTKLSKPLSVAEFGAYLGLVRR